MAEAGADDTFVSLELIETWKQNSVCFFCKKHSSEAKLKCEKCLEFEYCSIYCLVFDRDAHEAQCNVIGVRKGIRHWVPDGFLKFVISRAELLDDWYDVKDENEAHRELEAIERLRSDQVKFGIGAKNKEKKKESKTNNEKYFRNKKHNPPLPVCGKFGGPFTSRHSRQEITPEEYFQVWALNQTAPLWMKPALPFPTAPVSVKLKDQDFARMKFADFYSDIDEYGEVNEASSVDQRRKQPESVPEASTCSFCGERGDALKICRRCKKSKYCDKVCQSKDFENHKIQCKRDHKFEQALKDIPTSIMESRCPGVSLNPMALAFDKKEAGRVHHALLLEIVETRFGIPSFVVLTKDVSGREIIINIFLPPDMSYQKINGKTGEATTVTLDTCIRPGNFILIFDPKCLSFISGCPLILTADLNDFHVVFADHLSTC